ncbi:MAG: hypothetical protein KKE69_00200 [Alphaproteobacteria bacterium]|nr:hypothetical protein [Alphaproteobacteria bacterium]MBU1607095.1 hypothetical protein [Alphaproteobacteria bacterium]
MDTGFDDYLDNLILEIADRQTGSEVVPTNILTIHVLKFPECPQSWAHLAASEMEARGWGKNWSTLGERAFMMNGGGASRAQHIRASRRKKSLREKVASVPRSDWVAIGALLVSALALFKSA